MKPAWTELPVYTGDVAALLEPTPVLDAAADAWFNRVVFTGTPYGVARGVAISIALAARKRYRAGRAARAAKAAPAP